MGIDECRLKLFRLTHDISYLYDNPKELILNAKPLDTFDDESRNEWNECMRFLHLKYLEFRETYIKEHRN